MAWQNRIIKRKKTGGKRKAYRTKRLHEIGRPPVETTLGETKRKIIKCRSGTQKAKLFSSSYVNVSDPSTGQTQRLRVLDVVSNPANVDYNRRGVLTKGAIIRTENGLAKISSRPGQDGELNAITYNEG